MTDFKKICKKYNEEALETLIKDCSIDSTFDEATSNKEMPYGKGVHEAFQFLKEFGGRKTAWHRI